MKRPAGRPAEWRREDNLDQYWAGWQLEIVRFNERRGAGHNAVAQSAHSTAMSASADDLYLQSAAHEMELGAMRRELHAIEARLSEAQLQRASLESIISERLGSERSAVANAETMRHALRTVTGRVGELTADRERDAKGAQALREEALQREKRIKQLEIQLAEVESFMGGSAGGHMVRLEGELARARLALAEAESEKDDLEQELASVRGGAQQGEGGQSSDGKGKGFRSAENEEEEYEDSGCSGDESVAPAAAAGMAAVSWASSSRRPLGDRSNTLPQGKAPADLSSAAAKRVQGAAAATSGVRRVLALESGT